MPISWWKSFGDDDLIHITLHMIIIPFACLYRRHSWEGLMGLPGFEPYGPAGTRARCVPILLGKGFSWILEDFHWSGEIPRNLLLGRHSQDPRKEGDRTIQVEPAMAMRKWGGTVGNLFDSGGMYKWLSLAHQTSCWAFTTSPGSPWHRSKFARRQRLPLVTLLTATWAMAAFCYQMTFIEEVAEPVAEVRAKSCPPVLNLCFLK